MSNKDIFLKSIRYCFNKACDISGASEVIKDWEHGFNSVLRRYYADNDKELSGGQWQLIGLARAYFKDSE